jgi:hypothetical protein
VPPVRSPRKKKNTALVVILSILALLLAAVVAIALVLPRVVAAKVDEAASKRALTIKFGGMGLPIGTATLRDVSIRPKASDRMQLAAPRVEAVLDGLSPSAIRVPTATVTLKGSIEEVLAAVVEVRDADAKVPAGERLPLDVLAGTLDWSDVAGEGTSLAFGTLKLAQRPGDGTLEATLGKGKLVLDALTLAPLDVKVKRTSKGKSGAALDVTGKLAAGDDGAATFSVHRDDDSDTFALVCDGLPLVKVGAGQAGGVDLRKAVVDGKASGSRSAEGAIRSEGKITLSEAKLPPIKAGSFTFQIGGEIVTKWKGTPKKGAPGVLRLDEASVEIKVAGRTMVVTLGGEVALGPKGEGPYAVHLTWALPKIDCSSIVASAGGGVVSSAVTGQVSASGTIDGDPTRPAKLKIGKTIDVGCTVDVMKALPALPGGLPKLPGFP